MSTNCEQCDWKAYALGELDANTRREAEAHAATCASCREELATLRLTLDAMATLRDEEMPRRIAFVSDKVFEPKWYQRLWSPTFAGASVVAVAILIHGFARPVGAVDQARIQAQIQAQVDQAVTKAVAQVEAKNQQQLEVMSDAVELLNKQFRRTYLQTGFVRQ
jgi:anti-sigma factor RsiW